MMVKRSLHVGFALVALAGSVAAGSVKADRDRDLSVLPPCASPAAADTTGWQAIRWTVKGHRLLVSLPASFYLDRRVRFPHGGESWTDGTVAVKIFNGGQYTCIPGSEDYPGCQECELVLGNVKFRLVSTYERESGTYVMAAVGDVDPSRTVTPSGAGDELRATSPYADDQELLLRIIHSIREDSRSVDRGVLFLGGKRLSPPYVLTHVDGRLVVNGYAMPDILPPLAPTPDGELETRKSVQAHLESVRDSLLAAGTGWARAQLLLAARARSMPFVDTVAVSERTPTAKGDPLRIYVRWKWGYRNLYIHETGAYSMGSGSDGEPAWRQTESLLMRRAERIRDRLQDGDVVFLLGGGSEVIVPRGDQDRALEDIERLKRDPSHRPSWMPSALRTQVLHPVRLQRMNAEDL